MNFDDPRDLGLLQFGLGMLQASGPRPYRQTFGAGLAEGAQQGLGAYQRQKLLLEKQREMEQERQLRQMQIDAILKRQQQEVEGEANLRKYLEGVGKPDYPMGATIMTDRGQELMKNAPVKRFDPLEAYRSGVPLPMVSAASGLMPKPKAPIVSKPGDIGRDPNDPTRVLFTNPTEEPERWIQIGNGLQQSTKTGKIAPVGHAPAASMTVNSFEPAAVALQREMAQSLGKTADALQAAPSALANIERAKSLIKDAGGFVGSFGETKLGIVKALNNNLGLNIDPTGVASAEELRSRIFFNVMDNLKKMDAQPSQLQQKIMMDALGNLGTDPNALPRVLDAFAEAIKGKVAAHNKRVQQARENKVPLFFDPTIDISNISAPKAQQKRTIGGKTYVKIDDQWYEE